MCGNYYYFKGKTKNKVRKELMETYFFGIRDFRDAFEWDYIFCFFIAGFNKISHFYR